MAERMLLFVKVALNWLFWLGGKLLLLNGDLLTGLTFEAASRLLGCPHHNVQGLVNGNAQTA